MIIRTIIFCSAGLLSESNMVLVDKWNVLTPNKYKNVDLPVDYIEEFDIAEYLKSNNLVSSNWESFILGIEIESIDIKTSQGYDGVEFYDDTEYIVTRLKTYEDIESFITKESTNEKIN